MNLPKIIAALLLAASLAGGAWFYWTAQARSEHDAQLLRVSGNIEVIDAEVSFKIGGPMQQRPIDEGEMVKKGQLVALLDTSDLLCDVALREAELAAAKAALDELEAGSRLEEIASAKAAMEKAAATWEDLKLGSRQQEIKVAEASLAAATVEEARLKSELERAQRLVGSQAITREDYDRAEAAHRVAAEKLREAREQSSLVNEGSRQKQIDAAKSAYEQAQAQYALVLAGPRQETIQQGRARMQQAQAALQLAKTRLDYATLVSPMDGVVLSKNKEPGEYVAPGTPVITVGDLVNVWVRAYIGETDLGRVKVGQEARVTSDSYPGKVYPGRVSFVASEAEFTPKNVQTEKQRVKLVFRIKIDIQNPEMELKAGMPVDAEIVLSDSAGY